MIVTTNDRNYAAIAKKIREKIGDEGVYMPHEMPDGIDDVYTFGSQMEYDKFWDNYQNKGRRRNYNFAFYGSCWNDIIFRPKYDIIIGDDGNVLTQMFVGSHITNLVDILKACGVKIDCSAYHGSNTVALFTSSTITHIPELDLTGAYNGIGNCFSLCKNLQSIEKIILKNDGSQTISSAAFQECTALKRLLFEGVIGSNMDIHWSPLSKDSILSIFTALSDTSDGKTVSFSLSAINKAFETAEGTGDGSTSGEWNDLLKTKLNWTVVLV